MAPCVVDNPCLVIHSVGKPSPSVYGHEFSLPARYPRSGTATNSHEMPLNSYRRPPQARCTTVLALTATLLSAVLGAILSDFVAPLTWSEGMPFWGLGIAGSFIAAGGMVCATLILLSTTLRSDQSTIFVSRDFE